jgi:hypothetical protein
MRLIEEYFCSDLQSHFVTGLKGCNVGIRRSFVTENSVAVL